MALNILQQHKKAFLDLLDADDVGPALVVLDGAVPLDPATGKPAVAPPYVVVYFAARTPNGDEEPDKVGKELPSDVLNATAYCHNVGGSAHTSLSVSGRTRAALRGATPSIPGRVCGWIRQVDGAPTQRDETTGTPVHDTVDVWSFTSLPG
jgi:hypothetical protein